MKNKFFFSWIAFHAAIFLSFLISLAVSPKFNFGTSLFDILPPDSGLHEVQAADTKLTARTGRAVTILVKADSFELAKGAAEKFYLTYADIDGKLNVDFFDSLSFYVDSDSVAEITAWLHENRFSLLDDETRGLLENGDGFQISEDALASVYGAFNFSDLSYLEEDPFLLSERSLKKLLDGGAVASTNMALRDDVLASENDGAFYVLVRGTVSEKGSSLTGKKSAVKSIYETVKILQKKYRDDGTEVDFVFSGVPFHSYENATSAQRQISVISTVALILIFAMFLLIFRSIVPAIASALAVVFSCAVGFVSVLLFFRGIHVLTFVFGTTLIGTCLDYSIHFFVNWKANLSCDSGEAVRKHIFRGVTLGFASTEICFAALFFAPFPLLKQVSVFLFTGLAASWLSVVALYPLLKMPKNRRGRIFEGNCIASFALTQKFHAAVRVRRLIPALLVIFSLVVIFFNRKDFRVHNNIQELYSMSSEMLQNEITSAKVMNTGSSGWYFILKANSEEELLQKNEELADYIEEIVSKIGFGNFLSVSQFIPSEKKQAQNYTAAKNLLPLADEQYEALGFSDSGFASGHFAQTYEENYRLKENNFVHPADSNLPATIRDAISNLWIGEIDGAFYSCVLPLHLGDPKSEIFFREYAADHDGIFFVNKVKDISSQLDVLSKTMLRMLVIAFVLVIVILLFCYKPAQVLKIAAVPVLVLLVTTSVLVLAKIHISFFPITALVLVFGLGLDYIIYAVEGSGEKSNLTSFAILLSFVTTALSFGALAFSNFPPVYMLGLTVFVGLTTAVLIARN
ncbi:MAG: MMPL family transporter [Treponema sp.]|nr:MMPL family transporter [Treponema sp.]